MSQQDLSTTLFWGGFSILTEPPAPAHSASEAARFNLANLHMQAKLGLRVRQAYLQREQALAAVADEVRRAAEEDARETAHGHGSNEAGPTAARPSHPDSIQFEE